jgi:hypothetical protein
MKKLRLVVLLFLISIVVAATPITVLNHSATFDSTTGLASFTMEFDGTLDLITVDTAGRNMHAFQYFFYGNLNLGYPAQYDSVVRCCETPGILVARDPEPNTGEPRSGGWGPVRARIPFVVQGNVLSFSAPLEVFSDREALSYRLLVGSYGSTTQSLTNVPEASAALLTFIGFAGLWTLAAGLRKPD